MLPAVLLLSASQGQNGNPFDMGGPSASLDSAGLKPNKDGFVDLTNNLLALRFTAHQSAAVTEVGFAVGNVNPGQDTVVIKGTSFPYQYYVFLCGADATGGLTDVSTDGNCGYFFSSINVGSLTTGQGASVAEAAEQTDTPLTAGKTYYLLIEPAFGFAAGTTTFAP